MLYANRPKRHPNLVLVFFSVLTAICVTAFPACREDTAQPPAATLVGGSTVAPTGPTQVETSIPTPTDTPAPSATPRNTPTPFVIPTPSYTETPPDEPQGRRLGPPTPTPPTPTPLPADPLLRYLPEKEHLLELVNLRRKSAGVPELTLGDNIAAQLHVEASLRDCTAGHWTSDGYSIYRKYNLAGGYQTHQTAYAGLNYCIGEVDQYPLIGDPSDEIIATINVWLAKPEPNPFLSRLNGRAQIGFVHRDYDMHWYVILEGSYVHYHALPTIENGKVQISGTLLSGLEFTESDQLGVELQYEPPPQPLTAGQLARSDCYTGGDTIALLIPPHNVGHYQSDAPVSGLRGRCKPPREIDQAAPAPGSAEQAIQLFAQAQIVADPHFYNIPRVRASTWEAAGSEFEVVADIKQLLDQHGPGAYTVLVWHYGDTFEQIISHYSIFHGVTPPDTYTTRR